MYDDIGASLQPNDEWKICFRNQHERAYKGLWRVNLSQGKIVKALLAAKKGRAQALRDLMDTKYYPGFFSAQSFVRFSHLCSIRYNFHGCEWTVR